MKILSLVMALIPALVQGAIVKNAPLDRVHFLIIADRQASNIGAAVGQDADLFEMFVREPLDEAGLQNKYVFHHLGKDGLITPDQVLQKIRGLKLTSMESLVVFYSGHGASNKVGGHVLTLSGGKLGGTLLSYEILATGAGKTAFISNSCYTMPGAPQNPMRVATAANPNRLRLIQDLFLRGRGDFAMNSASQGQFAWADSMGLFTRAFLQILYRARYNEFDTDQDGYADWREIFNAAKNDTQQLFLNTKAAAAGAGNASAELQASTEQTPVAFALPLFQSIQPDVVFRSLIVMPKLFLNNLDQLVAQAKVSTEGLKNHRLRFELHLKDGSTRLTFRSPTYNNDYENSLFQFFIEQDRRRINVAPGTYAFQVAYAVFDETDGRHVALLRQQKPLTLTLP